MINLKILLRITVFIVIMAFNSCSNVIIETEENFEAVELPDGSLAYLNYNSSLKYDENFDQRSIELHGEIFLSVTEGETPFIVNTDLCEIKVIGTKFNVKSDNKETAVEVEEGSVELKTKQGKKKVGRGESAVYKKDGNGIKKGKAEFKFKIWMNSLEIEFKNLGKEIKHGSKQIGKESKEVGKELKKEMKKLKKK